MCLVNVPGERNARLTESQRTENENAQLRTNDDSSREFHEGIEEMFAVDSIDPNIGSIEYPDILIDAEFDEEFESDFNFSKAT